MQFLVVDFYPFKVKNLALEGVDEDVLLVVLGLRELVGPHCRLRVIQVLAVHLILNFIKSNQR